MRTLFLFIPHYVFSSDLLRTNFIKNLSKIYKVIVFSPVFKSNIPENYYRSPNLEYVPWSEEYPKFWMIFTKLFRASMIREFDHLEYYKLRRLHKINLNWQRKILRAASYLLPRKILTTDFFTKLEKLLLPNSAKFRACLQKYRPDLILTCTPGFNAIEAEAIILAKKNGFKTAAIDSSWDNYTANAIQFRKTDYLISWNKVMKKEAAEIHHYPENRLFISGVYRFDHHFQKHEKDMNREEFLKSKNLDPKLKTLLLATVPPNTYPPQYNVWRAIVKMRQNQEFRENVNLFIRLHPNDVLEKYAEFQNIKNLHIELPGKSFKSTGSSSHKIEMDEADLDNLRYSLKYTDVNINFRSSLSLEAAIYDQPVINVALESYANRYHVDWYIPIIQSGGVRLVTSNDELKNAINQYLKNPTLNSEGRKKIFNEYVGFSDGLSYERSLKAVGDIIERFDK